MSVKKTLPSSLNKNQSKTDGHTNNTPRFWKNCLNSSRMLGGSATKSSNLSQLNSTVCSIRRNVLPYIPQDADFDADMAYSEYLQTLAMKSISTKLISEDKIAWDFDLCDKNEILMSKEADLFELEHKHEIIEMKTSLHKLFLNLKSVLDKWLHSLGSTNIAEKLDNIIKVLNDACNKLEMENITPLTTSADYMKLNQSIVMYATVLKSLQHNKEDAIALNNLAKQLTKCNDLCNDVYQDTEHLKLSTIDYIHLWYKTFSDAYADENKNRQLYSF